MSYAEVDEQIKMSSTKYFVISKQFEHNGT